MNVLMLYTSAQKLKMSVSTSTLRMFETRDVESFVVSVQVFACKSTRGFLMLILFFIYMQYINQFFVIFSRFRTRCSANLQKCYSHWSVPGSLASERHLELRIWYTPYILSLCIMRWQLIIYDKTFTLKQINLYYMPQSF